MSARAMPRHQNGTGTRRQFAMPAHEICVQVSFDHIFDLEAVRLGLLNVLIDIALGIDDDPVAEAGAAKSVSHEHTFDEDTSDPEVLELRYPALLERFEIVRGSGGKGQWRAGDGTLRVIRFLEKMECAILSGFRKLKPFGLHGGEDGQVGENWVRRKDGRLERLKGSDQTVLEPGGAIIVKTPTGGGFGDKRK